MVNLQRVKKRKNFFIQPLIRTDYVHFKYLLMRNLQILNECGDAHRCYGLQKMRRVSRVTRTRS
jgi:hypothetical protein